MGNNMYMHAYIFQTLSRSPSIGEGQIFPFFPWESLNVSLWNGGLDRRGGMFRIGVCLHLENAASLYIESSYSCFQMNMDYKLTNDWFLWRYHRRDLYVYIIRPLGTRVVNQEINVCKWKRHHTRTEYFQRMSISGSDVTFENTFITTYTIHHMYRCRLQENNAYYKKLSPYL